MNRQGVDKSNPSYRGYILGICREMPINDHQVFDAKLMEAAWPASDREANSPADCLRADLGSGFEVRELADEPGAVDVHRLM
jgi:hypothetical protein